MGSNEAEEKAHVVCVPFPTQGHINPMLALAKLLHAHGFFITFVITDFNHKRLVRAQRDDALAGLPDFQFQVIPDGLPNSDDESTQDAVSLCGVSTKNCLAPFRRLVMNLNNGEINGRIRPVACIVSDGAMSFTLDVSSEFGIPNVFFWASSASGYLAFQHYRHLVERGIIPLKNMADVTNGFLDKEVDWIPGLMKGMRLKDFPSWIRTTDGDDVMLNFKIHEMNRATMASAILFNTFDDLEAPALNALHKFLPPIYAVGPFSILSRHMIPDGGPLAGISTSLLKQDTSCLQWLDGKKPRSIVYVSFGSITVMTNEQLVEFAWGLANSGYEFIWVIRPDQAKEECEVLPQEFVEETKGRGMTVEWCPQEKLLAHPAIGVFLTHSGWNSTVESLCGGVPMICWPYFSEQMTNCRYVCGEWGVGMELGDEVKREVVERVIREIMEGEEGREIRRKAAEWRESAIKAGGPRGSSVVNLSKVVRDIILQKERN